MKSNPGFLPQDEFKLVIHDFPVLFFIFAAQPLQMQKHVRALIV